MKSVKKQKEGYENLSNTNNQQSHIDLVNLLKGMIKK
jgi:hypothetical protein